MENQEASCSKNVCEVEYEADDDTDLKEIQDLQGVNVWVNSQEVLENQALKELELFATGNDSNSRPDLEEGEISDKEEQTKQIEPKVVEKAKIKTLNIEHYIKRQEELKKHQILKKSVEVSEHSKKVAESISKQWQKSASSKPVKRKQSCSDNEFLSKKSKVKSEENDDKNQNHENESDSDYVPRDSYNSDSDYEPDVCQSESNRKSSLTKTPNRKISFDKVKDDGNVQYYKARLKQYYSQLEEDASLNYVNTEDGDIADDIVLKGGLKILAKTWINLYSYQQDGVKWLWKIHQKVTGGLLGDEMGLGKTVQVIAFLAALEHSKISPGNDRYVGLGPTLIITPVTVLHQWVKHFHEWAPEFRVAILHQSGSFLGNKTQLIKEINKSRGILVTTYLGILKYKGVLNELDWHYVVLDEGHKIRNPGAKVSVAVKQIRTPHRLMLTGSPMQNNLQELWSLFDFTVPGMLGTLPTFLEHFANPIMQGGYANATPMQEATALTVATVLKDMISPFLLRRSKLEVKDCISLPNKSEQVLFCTLTGEQHDLYKGYLMGEHVNIILGRGAKNWFSENYMRSNVLVAITTLRKICNHPDLYLEDADDALSNNDDTAVEDRFGYYKRSGKMIVVSALLKIWKRQKHRVLLFTQSRAMINIFADFLENQGYTYLKMDGSTSVGSRQPLIDKFNQDASYDVFLSTTRVGGLGVNLTGANRVIIYDPDWNPATDTQARERAWRIGQDKQVTVYRLISAGTIEEKMYQRQVWKQLLSNKVLLDPKTQRFFKSSDLHDLFSLQEQTKDVNPETANIFRNSRVNLQERLEKAKEEKSSKSQQQESAEPFQFSDEKIKAMKKLAQQISQSMNKNEAEKPRASKSSYQKELEEEMEQRKKEKARLKSLTPMELRLLNRNKTEQWEEWPANKIDDFDTNLTFSTALEIAEKTAKVYHEIKSSKIKDTSVDSISSNSQESQSGSGVLENRDEPKSARSDEHRNKHKSKHKKKKSKDKHKMTIDNSGTIEGEKVEGLVKTEMKKYKKEKLKNEAQDLYVLEKLFAKKGVHTALQHDVIVQSGSKEEETVRIHSEARRRADLAVEALRKSRLKSWHW